MARKPMSEKEKAAFAAKMKAARAAKKGGAKKATRAKTKKTAHGTEHNARTGEVVERNPLRKPTYRPRWNEISGGVQKVWHTRDGRKATLTVMGEKPKRKGKGK